MAGKRGKFKRGGRADHGSEGPSQAQMGKRTAYNAADSKVMHAA